MRTLVAALLLATLRSLPALFRSRQDQAIGALVHESRSWADDKGQALATHGLRQCGPRLGPSQGRSPHGLHGREGSNALHERGESDWSVPSGGERGREMRIRPIRGVPAMREVARFTSDFDRPSFGTLRGIVAWRPREGVPNDTLPRRHRRRLQEVRALQSVPRKDDHRGPEEGSTRSRLARKLWRRSQPIRSRAKAKGESSADLAGFGYEESRRFHFGS